MENQANHSNYRVLLTLFAMMLVGLYAFPNHASAITLTPTRFEVSGSPGDVITENVMLINEHEESETLYPSFANFEAQGDSGSPAFTEPKDDLGTWMSTEVDSVTLVRGQQKAVSFTITIPKDAEPGGHFAVVFWGTAKPGSNGQVAIGGKTGVLVLLSVKGDVKESAGLLNFNTIDKKFFYNTLPVSFEYRFKNDGGDRIKPAGVITIRDTVFLPAETLDANQSQGNILPGSTRKFKVDWVNYERPNDYVIPSSFFGKFWSNVTYQWKNFAVGLYSANFNVSYGIGGEQAKKTVFFFVFPWQLVLVMIIVFVILFWSGRKLIKRYNRFIIDKARAGIKLPPEQFNDRPSL
ncbi:hypothetical protein K2P96_00545 [Patescibacteria group bacterium]|nr:hypothetical protein [Patescibacteria group bacterium]